MCLKDLSNANIGSSLQLPVIFPSLAMAHLTTMNFVFVCVSAYFFNIGLPWTCKVNMVNRVNMVKPANSWFCLMFCFGVVSWWSRTPCSSGPCLWSSWWYPGGACPGCRPSHCHRRPCLATAPPPPKRAPSSRSTSPRIRHHSPSRSRNARRQSLHPGAASASKSSMSLSLWTYIKIF